MKTVILKNLAELNRFAAEFAAGLRGGEIVGLIGDLGSGKTAFVKALAAALGSKKSVRSPTFILMQLIAVGAATKKQTSISQICHVDAYRLKDDAELRGIGFYDFAGRPDTVTFVEWADLVPGIRQTAGYRELRFSFSGASERLVLLP
ncbi:MAG: tRNA (adenosine(37)-N6)-threonylcarbamoyltransferase complex ATPase subunit type 1 TsaE [Patescibacteria group bacterium]|jgi:tRNA threonylcarbamoyladenosine biosynthesis protein TsaE